jgi:hypothetical protein
MAKHQRDARAAASATCAGHPFFDTLRHLPPDVVDRNILELLTESERQSLKSSCRAGRMLVTSCLGRLMLQPTLLTGQAEEQQAALQRFTGASCLDIRLDTFW